MQPFPWQEAMRVGFGVLRLSPAAFWAMTPRELAAAIEAERASWRELEAAMNAELRTARRERTSWGITGMAFGVITGAMLR